MRLSVSFDELERVAGRFISERAFNLSAGDDSPWEDIDVQLQDGVEVNLSDLTVVDGLLSYQGRHVILYIRDHGRGVSEALLKPEKGRKYHLADCDTLDWMRNEQRFERYVVTRKATGLFEISGVDSVTRQPVSGETGLQVCMNCLKRINYKAILLLSQPGRHAMRSEFKLTEFFETYSTRFRELPAGFADSKDSAHYSSDWQEISSRVREGVGYTCQECRVCLVDHRSLLHVHHINGVKSDNRAENLRALCKDCHRREPQHGHIYLKAKEMDLLYRLRRAQGLLVRSWESALKHADLAVRPVLEMARHRGWDPPDVGLPLDSERGEPIGLLDAAWERSRRAISSSVTSGRIGHWMVQRPGEVLDELSEGMR